MLSTMGGGGGMGQMHMLLSYLGAGNGECVLGCVFFSEPTLPSPKKLATSGWVGRGFGGLSRR